MSLINSSCIECSEMCLPSVRSHFPLYSANKNDLVWGNFDPKGTSMEKVFPDCQLHFYMTTVLKKILILLRHLDVNASWKVLFKFKWMPFCAFKWNMSSPLGGGLYIIARNVGLKINWMHCSRSASS